MDKRRFLEQHYYNVIGLDGEKQYIEVNGEDEGGMNESDKDNKMAELNLSNQFTISVWIKPKLAETTILDR